MDGKIINSKENRILGRREIAADVSFEKSTPPRKEIKDFLCGKIGANPESAVISNISSKFGSRSAVVILHVYADKKAALATEPRHILVRDGMAEKKAAPAAQKK